MLRSSRLLLATFFLTCLLFTPAEALPKADSYRARGQADLLGRRDNPTDAFCKDFNAQCYHTALAGKTGRVDVVYDCRRNGDKNSISYSFGCTVNGQDETQKVLDRIGAGYSVTTTKGSTVVVTGTRTAYTTSTSKTTSTAFASTSIMDRTTTGTSTKTLTSRVTATRTTTFTTAIPVTSTCTSTKTITTTTPITKTVATTTTTSVKFGTEAVTILQVVLGPTSPNRKRLNKVDSSSFCSAYSSACTSECTRVSSSPKHVVCHASKTNMYSLTCYCKNGKKETQHALAAAADQEHVSTVSTVATSTTYATITRTTIVPSTILTTSHATLTTTSYIPVTKTTTTTSTATRTTTLTSHTGKSSITTQIGHTTSTTKTVTLTILATATSTTQIIIAPTGAVQVINQTDHQSEGYLYYDTAASMFYTVTTVRAKAQSFAAVLDPVSGLYQLQLPDGSGQVLVAEAGAQGADFTNPNQAAYAWNYPGAASLCGSSGTAAGPPSGAGTYAGNPCETFVFLPGADTSTTAQLRAVWINPGKTSANQYTWGLDGFSKGLYEFASTTGFTNFYNEQVTPVQLKFPV